MDESTVPPSDVVSSSSGIVPGRVLGNGAAMALVFFSSAAVLVLEIVAGRLLAPYVGVTLETFTTIIGVVLAGIAVGTWAGGRLVDRIDPRVILGPLLIGGGALSFAVIPIIRILGPAVPIGSIMGLLLLTTVALFVPAALVSAVSPAVVKLQLSDLSTTGQVVGRFSAVGTAGGLFGTFVTGFVLVAAIPSPAIMMVVGASLGFVGLALWFYLTRPPLDHVAAVLAMVIIGVGFNGAVRSPCQTESAYFCISVIVDEDRPDGRVLVLDSLRHSYVDLGDPSYLEFAYTQIFADVITAAYPGSGPVEALHIGGGGFTMPRWIDDRYEDTYSMVLELDAELVEIAQAQLGLALSDRLEVRTGDARMGLRAERQQRESAGHERAYQIVIGDAFGGQAVPWHLTTVEVMADIKSLMSPDGIYVINVIDFGPLDFARAEAATLASVFDHISVIAPMAGGGNLVLVGSDRPLRVDIGTPGHHLIEDPAAWYGSAPILRDAFAPVDQLMTPA